MCVGVSAHGSHSSLLPSLFFLLPPPGNNLVKIRYHRSSSSWKGQVQTKTISNSSTNSRSHCSVTASNKGFCRIQLAPEDPLTSYHWHSSAGFDDKGFPACLSAYVSCTKIAESKTQADSKEKNSAELG